MKLARLVEKLVRGVNVSSSIFVWLIAKWRRSVSVSAAFVVRLAGFRLMPKPLNPQHHDIADFDCSNRKSYGRLIAFQR